MTRRTSRRSPAWILALLSLSFLASCSASHAPSIDGSAPPSDATGGDAGDDVMCESGTVVFPTFSRACTTSADCAIARHQIDCCGSFVRTGILVSEVDAFTAAEAECEAEYPRCRCAARPDTADDGSSDGPSVAAVVACVDAACQTRFLGTP